MKKHFEEEHRYATIKAIFKLFVVHPLIPNAAAVFDVLAWHEPRDWYHGDQRQSNLHSQRSASTTLKGDLLI
jgi:hypothetical protein